MCYLDSRLVFYETLTTVTQTAWIHDLKPRLPTQQYFEKRKRKGKASKKEANIERKLAKKHIHCTLYCMYQSMYSFNTIHYPRSIHCKDTSPSNSTTLPRQ